MIEDEIEWFRLCLHECAHSKVAHIFGIDTVRIQVRGGLRGGGYAQFDNFSRNPVAALAVVMAGGLVEQICFGRAEGCNGDKEQIAEYIRILGWDEERAAVLRRMVQRQIKADLPSIISAAKQMTRPSVYSIRWSVQ